MVGKVGIEVLLQFYFQVVCLGLNVDNYAVFKFLVTRGGHGEGKTQEEVGNKGG
jgi:hypothetical protein